MMKAIQGPKHQQAIAEIMRGGGGDFRPVLGDSGQGLLDYLVHQAEIPSAGVATLREESLSILTACAPPIGSNATRTGLVCGYVQSGKTMSMEMVSALAKDNGFRIIVLLAGVTTNLVEQSVQRMEQHLRAGAGGYDWVMIENPRNEARGQLDAMVQEWRRHPHPEPGSQVLFITVLKHVSHLRALAELLGSLDLSATPALVFDDEADQASMNTRPNAPEPSPVYQAIDDVRASLPHHTLLQYTATPQAPLLISRIDSRSADFAELVSPGQGYAGGQVFFQDRIQDLVSAIPDSDILDPDNLPPDPPPSLIAALQIYFVGVVAAYAKTGSPARHRSMLIHPHQRRSVHAVYLRWVELLKRDWVDTLSAPNDPDRPPLLQEFQSAHAELARTVTDLPPFEEVTRRLPTAISRAIPTMVNSDNGREIPWSNGYAHILVGGEKLGRGYTVRGLTVTYMSRGPGGWTADTIQQRARFFGYHARPSNDYVDYCRVRLHRDVLDVYVAYIEHEEDVRRQIRNNRGRSLRNLKRAFFLDAGLRPTRHNIMQRLYRRPLTVGWFEQQAPQAAPHGGADNATLVQALLAHLQLQPDGSGRHFYADANLQDVVQNFLIDFECPYERDEVYICAIRLILGVLAVRPDAATCRLVFMDHQRPPRLRTVSSETGTLDLQQGRSSSDDPTRYPGDRHVEVNAPDRVTIQIHTVNAVDRDDPKTVLAEKVPALAIYIPAKLQRDVIAQPSH